jgi:hypothetical protein
MNSQQEQELRAQVDQVRETLDGLTANLRVVDDEVESLAPRREQHELLDQACGSLEKLEELGAASLFWGERIAGGRVAEQLREVRGRIGEFQAQLDELEAQRQAILVDIGRQEENLEILGEDIYDVLQAEERRKAEWVVERDIGPLPNRVQRMAWARGGEEDRLFRKSLGGSLLASLVLGALLPMIDLPLPKRFVPEEMPKRLAQLVRPELPKPLPQAPPVAEEPPEQMPPDPTEPEPLEQAAPEQPDIPAVAAAEPIPDAPPGPLGPLGPEAPPVEARTQVRKAGILAFRDEFASLAQDKVAPRLGADARYDDADDVSSAMPSRSMLTTNTPGSSGGINIGSLSRNVGGGGGGGAGGMHGVQIGRATSAITPIGGGGGGGGGGGRPRARDGQAPSRTDEEIQIVFDRYKASFYRLYNRELRQDPTLRGQMVLRLTIEPDGSVSMCELQSSDMEAPELAAQVVNRVLTINFGAKEGVQALTIVYPIDFLPKA